MKIVKYNCTLQTMLDMDLLPLYISNEIFVTIKAECVNTKMEIAHQCFDILKLKFDIHKKELELHLQTLFDLGLIKLDIEEKKLSITSLGNALNTIAPILM